MPRETPQNKPQNKLEGKLQDVAERYSVAITPVMRELIDANVADGPIAKQFLPDARELIHRPDESPDPIGDDRYSPVAGIVHRYPDRVLLLPVTVCPVYCRYCFRRETVGGGEQALLGDTELTAAFDYIRGRPEIWEVILSGGDPLILSQRRLSSILEQLRKIPHVRVIRIHSRVPLVAPERITETLSRTLRAAAPLFVVLHCNHADEFTGVGEQACARLVDAGVPMLSQSVLLRGINDDVATLERLFRRLVENRIKPYYLHHMDRAPGTSHFRTGIGRGRALTEALRGHVSGLCQPSYVLDVPGGYGKTPLSREYAQRDDNGCWQIRDYRDTRHRFEDSQDSPHENHSQNNSRNDCEEP